MHRAEVQRYGRLTVHALETPTPGEGQVLVRVVASSVNAVDWYGLSGRPYIARPMIGLRKPKSPTLGGDFAGVVEAAGNGVDLQPGDEVFGYADGAFGDYLLAGDVVARTPTNTSLEDAAAVPIAGFAALQGLRDHGAVKEGARVLVNGASGGVGTFALQVAKALGARVDAVCSTHNVEQAKALGAERAFDYTREDFTRSGERYDVIFDNAGNRSWWAMRRVLSPGGIVVLVGGPRRKRLLGPLGHIAAVMLASKLTRQRAAFFIAKPNRDDLVALRELVESGAVKPAVERYYPFAELAEVLRVMGEGHARAKLVVTRRSS